MPIQIGYCNGRNTTYNGFEYHKGSEINIAVTDFMLVLWTYLGDKKTIHTVLKMQRYFFGKGYSNRDVPDDTSSITMQGVRYWI